MIKIGYGKSNYESLIRENCHYVDRTQYFERLEESGAHFLFFLRPRRFGKSLWISQMEYYYGVQHKDKFETLFGKYYIGKNPTITANRFLILLFDFSGIDTTSLEKTKIGFYNAVRDGVITFFDRYPTCFSEEAKTEVLDNGQPETLIKTFFRGLKESVEKIYLLIDEYDHFANELMAFDLQGFLKIVSKNGFVRKFYEMIKTATRNGIVERMFVTGVSPITLDAMTSGFNIATQISLSPYFHDLMGFKKEEVEEILLGVGVEEANLKKVMSDIKKWYNGYLFNVKAEEQLYNSDMVLYFAQYFLQNKSYPEEMLDINIASDYTKIRKMFQIGGKEAEKIPILEKFIKNERVLITLTAMFSFEKQGFPMEDLLSLLFYMGFLTIKKKWGTQYELTIPNKVIRDLYFDYFLQVTEQKAKTNRDLFELENALNELIWENKPDALAAVFNATLKGLTNRDFQTMDEKHVQAMFYAYLNLSKMYEVKSEYESEKKYFDILMLETPLAEAENEFIFEFKYAKKAGEIAIETIYKNAKSQMLAYLASQELLNRPKMKAWVIIVIGDKIEVFKEVKL